MGGVRVSEGHGEDGELEVIRWCQDEGGRQAGVIGRESTAVRICEGLMLTYHWEMERGGGREWRDEGIEMGVVMVAMERTVEFG